MSTRLGSRRRCAGGRRAPLAAVLIALAAAVAAPVSGAHAATTTATGLTTTASPSWGVYRPCSATNPANCASVYSIVGLGSTVVLGGNFTELVSPTGTTMPATDIAELSESTGAPVPGFAGSTGGPVYTLATDGTNLYAGGHFPGSFARVDPATGAIVWRGHAKATSYALLPVGAQLYVGGFMGVWRVSASTGYRDPTFAPVFTAVYSGGGRNAPWTTVGYGTYYVHGLALSPDGTRLYVSGHFDTVNGVAQRTIAAVDPATGTHTDPGFLPVTYQAVTNPQYQDGIDTVATADNNVLLCQAGQIQAIYKFTAAGSLSWSYKPSGDCQTTVLSPDASTVYIGGHMNPRLGGTAYHALSFDYATGARLPWGSSGTPAFTPDVSPDYWGVWTLQFINGDLWAGGVFTAVQSGATSTSAPKVALFR